MMFTYKAAKWFKIQLSCTSSSNSSRESREQQVYTDTSAPHLLLLPISLEFHCILKADKVAYFTVKDKPSRGWTCNKQVKAQMKGVE